MPLILASLADQPPFLNWCTIINDWRPDHPLCKTGAQQTGHVDNDMYHYPRNPLYTGLTLCYCGLSFAIDNAWQLALLPITLIAVQIAPEGRYLEQKFGDDYRAYRKRVRRWL